MKGFIELELDIENLDELQYNEDNYDLEFKSLSNRQRAPYSDTYRIEGDTEEIKEFINNEYSTDEQTTKQLVNLIQTI